MALVPYQAAVFIVVAPLLSSSAATRACTISCKAHDFSVALPNGTMAIPKGQWHLLLDVPGESGDALLTVALR